MVKISFYNAPRRSVLANLRFVDVDRAQTNVTGEKSIVVGKHKTSAVLGAAVLTLSREDYDLLKYYRMAI